MINKIRNKEVKIIAGPCSINNDNVDQLFEIAKIKTINSSNKLQRAVWGLRVVGLKSRSKMKEEGVGMGMDFKEYMHNLNVVVSKQSFNNFKIFPSIKIAKKLIKETGLVIATEIMNPLIQLPLFEKNISKGKLFIWNPAVNQLGYQMHIMGIYAKRNDWFVGIKNGKWFGGSNEKINTMEKNWIGQISFATEDNKFFLHDKIVMIQRGVDVKNKGKFRNLPIHNSAKKVKNSTDTKMFFDPSHSLGPLLRNKIVNQTILAMRMKDSNGEYLYDGILIEVGKSSTDTKQHTTIKELQKICDEISKFRNIASPDC